jgi:hypothetical protein
MALEPEFKPILDREKHKHDFDEHLPNIEKLLKDIVNYGSNLIPRCFTSSNRDLKDSIIIGTFLKQVVAMIDSAEILISNAAIYSSNLQLRAVFEASIYIDWILKSDTDKKAKYFYVSNLREFKFWALRAKGESPDQVQFDQITREINLQLDGDIDKIKAEAERQIVEIDRVLSRPSFCDINAHIQKYKDKNKLHYEPSWYYPLGVSIRKIAIDVERLPEYEFIYSQTSTIMHSTKYSHHIQFGNGKLVFEPIRSLKEINNILTFLVGCTFRTYLAILKHYRPDEVQAFSRKYIEDWRNAFLNIPIIEYSTSFR